MAQIFSLFKNFEAYGSCEDLSVAALNAAITEKIQAIAQNACVRFIKIFACRI